MTIISSEQELQEKIRRANIDIAMGRTYTIGEFKNFLQDFKKKEVIRLKKRMNEYDNQIQNKNFVNV